MSTPYKLDIYRDVSFHGIETYRYVATAHGRKKSFDRKEDAEAWLKQQHVNKLIREMESHG